MIELALAALLSTWTPGPDDPVCEPGQVVEIDHCSQGQLPEEVIGRVITDENGIDWKVIGLDVNGNQILEMVFPEPAATPTDIPSTAPVAEVGTVDEHPKPITELAHTGVREEPYLLASGVLLLAGGALVLVSRKTLAR